MANNAEVTLIKDKSLSCLISPESSIEVRKFNLLYKSNDLLSEEDSNFFLFCHLKKRTGLSKKAKDKISETSPNKRYSKVSLVN